MMVRLVPTAALAWAVACANQVDQGDACDLLPGDLVISEVLPNPAGHPDTGQEWFEVFNATSQALTLDRLLLQRLALAGGEAEVTSHVVRGAGQLAAGEYFVLGDGVVGARPFDYSYRNNTEAFGSLNNEAGGIGLRCKNREIDTVWYSADAASGDASVSEGRSTSFDGGVAPDASRNDDGVHWCSGGEAYDGVNLGTPGSSNIACGSAACDDAGVVRDVVPPGPGDLIVTEVFGNATGSDTLKEWVEVYVAGSTAVDLNGLRVSAIGGTTRDAVVGDLTCVRGEPGDHLVLGATRDRGANGGVDVDAIAAGLERDGGMLTNAGGTIELWRGRALVDRAAVPEYEEGRSMSLEPLDSSSLGNDGHASFCPAMTGGLFDESGTPGATNDPCRSCWTGTAFREPNSPGVGDIVITEVFPNPDGADSGYEWVELYVAAGAAVDVNGLWLENRAGSTRTTRVVSAECVSLDPGAFAVVGGEALDALDVATEAVLAGDDLYNDGATLSLFAGSVLIDAIPTYEDPGSGVSWSLDAGVQDALGNDVADAWCPAADTGVFDGTGSPGQANGTVCP